MLNKMKTKKCRNCKAEFTPTRPFEICCGYLCSIEYARAKITAKRKKDTSRVKREFKNSDKCHLKMQVQKIANRLGKLQNMIKGHNECVTCGAFSENQMDGGHAFPTSTYSPIRYYTLQIRPQCVKCNRFNGGQPKEYRAYLASELGEDKVRWLESHKGKITKKFTVEYLQKYKKAMGKRLKRQEKAYSIK